MHHGKPIFYYGDGLADIEKDLKPDEDTVYCIASCTKAFIAATCGILVNKSKLSWSKPIHNYVPEFKTKHNLDVGKHATLLDLCSHGTGLAPVDHSVCGFHDEFFDEGKDQVSIGANLPVAYGFRSQFLYNNTMLGIIGDVIAKVSGKFSGTVLRDEIFEPLGMTRSCTKTADHPKDGNVAIGYSLLDDGTFLPWRFPALEDGGLQAGARYVRSTAREMLIWVKAIMDAEAVQGSRTLDIHPREKMVTNPLRDIPLIRSAHRPITHEFSFSKTLMG